MRILIVKLSSLGDVVHAMPAVQDIRTAFPQARIDWVVESAFVALAARCDAVEDVVACDLRRWRKAPLAHQTRAEWRNFREILRGTAYDAVIDLQGLTKSALVSRVAKLARGGNRYALANRTEGSSYEAPARWAADIAIRLEPHVHAVTRSRELCARALGYETRGEPRYGLRAANMGYPRPSVCLVHGTSRDDKCWPEDHWIEVGRRLAGEGFAVALPHGNDAERERSERIAGAVGHLAKVWPRMDLGLLTDHISSCASVIGIDSGLSHVAVALNLPHVQIYNFDTAWRTGPIGNWRQQSVFAQPHPSVDDVWHAWQAVRRPA